LRVGLLFLALSLPVPLVSLDSKSPHLLKGLGLALGRDHVLEAVGKAFVVLVTQGPVVPARADSVAVETEVVPVYPLVRVHVEAGEATLGLSFIISQAKVQLDFGDEGIPVSCPFIWIGLSSCWSSCVEEFIVVVVFTPEGQKAKLGSGQFDDFELLLKPFKCVFGEV
jgi:hypothetical protein